ncbi:MAG: hypothetical protein P8Z77_17280 [Candidatus Thiodiazotropha sp.]
MSERNVPILNQVHGSVDRRWHGFALHKSVKLDDNLYTSMLSD